MGHLGGESDAGIFSRSRLLQVLQNNEFGIPGPRNVGSAGPIPHCIVGDEAFPLSTFLMRPYSGRAACGYQQKAFNYRLSRARRLIENSFGILANRWRILRRPFKAKPENVESIIKPCVVLHNFALKTSPASSMLYNPPGYTDYEDSVGNVREGAWRRVSRQLGSLHELGGVGFTQKGQLQKCVTNLHCTFQQKGKCRRKITTYKSR
ncbi:uncharacterized protein LOC135371291 [Ornithodoros turicata]|uniref:uncharacterized protein LOC135371291 n=1 Tax=Ornithodoros turicata TaxID=34597 RepID=UPI003138AD74